MGKVVALATGQVQRVHDLLSFVVAACVQYSHSGLLCPQLWVCLSEELEELRRVRGDHARYPREREKCRQVILREEGMPAGTSDDRVEHYGYIDVGQRWSSLPVSRYST